MAAASERRVVLIGYPCGDGRDSAGLPASFRERLQAIDPGVELVHAPVPSNKELLSRMRAGQRAELLRFTDRFLPNFSAHCPTPRCCSR